MRTALPDNVRANLRANGMPLALRLSEGLGAWQPIETAPKDGTELLGWRWDAGCMLISWTAPCNFMTTDELESTANGDSAWQEQEDWFYADFLHGGRLEGSETPTHWTPMPAQPQVASDAPMTVAPEVGERYWMVQVGRIENCHWLNNYYDGAALAQGRVFATEADAQACWDAYFGAPK